VFVFLFVCSPSSPRSFACLHVCLFVSGSGLHLFSGRNRRCALFNFSSLMILSKGVYRLRQRVYRCLQEGRSVAHSAELLTTPLGRSGRHPTGVSVRREELVGNRISKFRSEQRVEFKTLSLSICSCSSFSLFLFRSIRMSIRSSIYLVEFSLQFLGTCGSC